MWKLGTASPAALRRGRVPGLHSDRYAPHVGPALATGIATLVAAVEDATA
jgi:hypothetical protein